MWRSHCKTIFPLDLDLRPCLDSSASRLRSEAVSGHGPLKPGEKRPQLGDLLTSRCSGLTEQSSGQGKDGRRSGTAVCPLQLLYALQSGSVDMGTAFRQRYVSEPGRWTRGSLTFGGPIVPSVVLNCTHILHETEQ